MIGKRFPRGGIQFLKYKRHGEKAGPRIKPKRPFEWPTWMHGFPQVQLPPDPGIFLDERDPKPIRPKPDRGGKPTDAAADDEDMLNDSYSSMVPTRPQNQSHVHHARRASQAKRLNHFTSPDIHFHIPPMTGTTFDTS